MERSTYGALAAVAVAGLGLAGLDYRGQAADRRAVRALEGRLEALAKETAQRAPPPPPQGAFEALAAEVASLGERIARLEGGLARAPVAVEAASGTASQEAEVASRGAAGTPGASEEAERQELEELIGRIVASGWDFSGGGADAMQRFMDLARGSDLLERMIAEQEAQVAASPEDPTARMELADLYIGKLMTVGAGPEQGIWGSRAEEQWTEVVALDPAHLRAHASLGTNYAYYPDVMGKADEAILHLERAREIQRDVPPAPEHAQTYLFLARMYLRGGEREKARDVLEEGLRLHPDSSALREALAELGS